MGEMDTTGSLSSRMTVSATDALTLKSVVQIQPGEGSLLIGEADYTSGDYCANLKMFNPNVRHACRSRRHLTFSPFLFLPSFLLSFLTALA